MNVALILLGGNGTRINSDLPKQYIKVNNKPIFIYTVEAFSNIEQIDSIVLVCALEYKKLVEKYIEEYCLTKVKDIVIGGLTRQESVRNGLSSKVFNKNDVVLIHDAARSNVSKEIILNNIEASKEHSVILTAIKETDTTYFIDNKNFETLDREKIFHAQTPQTFAYSLIRELHNIYKDTAVTDDVSLAIKEGFKPYIVIGSKDNFKITTNEDLNNFITIKGER